MDEAFIEQLLYENEGTELDFKRDQYPLTNPAEKGELTKDILTFANAWRRADAYILIGVDENKVNGRSTPVGVTTHLNDANLQQMVNSKTNRPVTFSYDAVSFKGLQVGVIKIPVQERPSFLTRDFGRLKKDVVYVRRGSSTGTSDLDEVLKMKADMSGPTLDLQFANIDTRILLGTKLNLISTVVEFEENKIPVSGSHAWDVPSSIFGNRNYKRDKAKYIFESEMMRDVGFSVFNSSSNLARNVRLEANIQKQSKLRVLDEYGYPTAPSHEGFASSIRPILVRPDINVALRDKEWTVDVNFGNIQPGAKAWTRNVLYIGSAVDTAISIDGFLYADNIPSPQPVNLNVKLDTTNRTLDIAELND
jgi:hypothetical protein